MPHLEPVQIAALAFALVVGLILGFIANTSGGKWRKRYQKDRDFYADYREKSEALIAHKSQQIAELEAALRAVPARVAEPVAPPAAPAEPVAAEAEIEARAPVDIAPVAIAAAPMMLAATEMVEEAPAAAAVSTVEAEAEPLATEVVTIDDPAPVADQPPAATGAALTRIRGIDAGLAARLADVGVCTPEDIEKLSAEDEMALEKRLSLSTGQIALEQWRLQAALLGSGEDEDHAELQGNAEPEHHVDATADPHDTVHPAPPRQMAVASEGAAAV